MNHATTAERPARTAEPIAPGFTAQEHAAIAAWSSTAAAAGLRADVYAGLYQYLAEALLVSHRSAESDVWLVHKTPAGRVAVRPWPSIAYVVDTLAEALAIIATATAAQQPRPRAPLAAAQTAM